jgi:hypothetical protein
MMMQRYSGHGLGLASAESSEDKEAISTKMIGRLGPYYE